MVVFFLFRFFERHRIFLVNRKYFAKTSAPFFSYDWTNNRMVISPKHMPHSPWSIVSMMTQPMSPLHSTLNTKIMKINTRAVWPHITTNCVITWENKISAGDTPATQLRSRRPSILSMISADDVSATAKKKTMLWMGKKKKLQHLKNYILESIVISSVRQF